MHKKRFIPVMAGLLLLVGAAAFLAGRMFNNQIGPLRPFVFGDKAGAVGISINLIPAEELPPAPPQTIGLFAERMDNIIVLQTTTLKTGGQGVVVHKNEEGDAAPSSNMDYGPKIEVLITNETNIYRETTPPVEHPSTQNMTVQQTVEETNLEGLTTQSFVSVWGRKSGDRIIAEVILVNTP